MKEEDEQLSRDWLTTGQRWKYLSKLWGKPSEAQLKNRWYSVLRHRLRGHCESADSVCLLVLVAVKFSVILNARFHVMVIPIAFFPSKLTPGLKTMI
jgi:hypothetical protein